MDPYTQKVSKVTTIVTGTVVLVIGVAAALVAVSLPYGILRAPRSAHAGDLWGLLIVEAVFGVFGAVLCTAGYRLLFGRAGAGAGSMLPKSLWLILCVAFAVLMVFGLVALLLIGKFNDMMFFSALSMGAFAWWCYRFGRRVP
jgi:hypothetical protein